MSTNAALPAFDPRDPAGIEDSSFVPVFHSFIQTHALPDHLLIDVGDYTHVPDGPGTVLVSHEANVYMDHTVGGRLGLFPANASFERAHDEMLAIVGAEDAYELHMNLIRHGRELCRPKPRCEECLLRRMCPWYRARLK